MDSYHRWVYKERTISMSCSAGPVRASRLYLDQRGKIDTNGLPVEIWPVSKCAEAFEYKMAKGEDVFKNNL